MVPFYTLQRGLVLAWLVCWAFTSAVLGITLAAAAEKPTKVVVLFAEGSQAGTQVAEQVLSRALQQRGYRVLDHARLAPPSHRERAELPLTARQLGARLGADIVISGYAQVHIQEKTYSVLDGKKVTVGQADVGARVILVSTGHVLVTDHAQARKPFDAAGTGAVEQATTTLADKLLAGFEQLHARQD